MRNNLIYLISIPYFIIITIVIVAKILEIPELENVFRPIPLFLMMLWYGIGSSQRANKLNWIFMLALFFSLLNDIFRIPFFNNFILALFFFFISHAFYASLFFWKSKGLIVESLLEGWLFVLIIFLILSSLLIGLLPPIIIHNLHTYLIAAPILIVVLFLLILASYVYSKVFIYNYGRFVLLGSLFFLFSDSLLAIYRFSIETNLSPAWIIGTYAIAHWFFVFGFLNAKNEETF